MMSIRCIHPALLMTVLIGSPALSAEAWTSYLNDSQLGIGFNDQALQINGAVATSRIDNRTQVAPLINSQLALADRIHLQTTLTGADWNTQTAPKGHSVETKLLLQPATLFIHEVEGTKYRNLDGSAGERLRLGLNGKPILAFLPISLKLKSSATIERQSILNSQPITLTGIDTVATRQLPASTTIEQLRLRYISQSGSNEPAQKSIAFSRSWQQYPWLRMRAEYERNEALWVDNVLRLNWLGSF